MPEALIILQPSLPAASRAAIARVASVKQTISDRVFVADISGTTLDALRATPGIDRVATPGDAIESLPAMSDAERLFAAGWLSSHGKDKTRPGDGLDWDHPPMVPPDPKR